MINGKCLESSIIEFRLLELSNGKNSLDSIVKRIFKECNIASELIKERVNKSIERLGEDGYFLETTNDKPKALIGASKRYIDEYGYPEPAVINWEITSACNLGCPHCYARAGKKFENELTKEQMFMIIDQLSAIKPGVIDFSGGEPLMRSDIFELLEYAQEKIDRKITKLKLLTNGMLINEEIAQKLSKYIDFAHISIDGLKSTHDEFRKCKGSYDAAINAIKLLQKNNIPVCITSTIHEKSFEEISKIIDLALEMKVNRLRFGFFTPTGRGASTYFYESSMTVEKKKHIYEYLAQKARELKDILPIDTRDRLYGLLEDDCGISDKYLLCRAGTRLMFITSRGELTPCYMLNEPEFYAGNVKDKSILDIWRNSEVFNKFRNININEIKGCQKCSKKSECGGGMRCGAYGTSKDILGNDPDCIFQNSMCIE